MTTKTKQKNITAYKIDRLGLLLADISKLTAKAERIKDELKERGVSAYDGNVFRATVSEIARTTYDPRKVEAALGEAISLVESVSTSLAVRVVSRNQEGGAA